MRTFIFYIALIISNLSFVCAQQAELHFRADGKFKIVQLTDIHYIHNNPNAEIALDNINSVLDAENPDLIVITGDIIYGKPAKESMETVIKLVSSKGKPFIALFGNHDDENGLSRKELLDLIKSFPNNITYSIDGISGVTNCTFEIKNRNGKDAFLLYCFDSNAYSQILGVKGYDIVRFDQIAWYREQSKAFKLKNNGDTIPALAFFHIPFPEYAQAAADERAPLIGTRREYVTCPNLNSGLFASMKEMGDVIATFVGHDHDNDYVTVWHDILLGYGRFSGANTVYNNLKPNGCRVIELTESEKSLKTWIRLRDGKTTNYVVFPDDFKK